jgi:hypothetical protein
MVHSKYDPVGRINGSDFSGDRDWSPESCQQRSYAKRSNAIKGKIVTCKMRREKS